MTKITLHEGTPCVCGTDCEARHTPGPWVAATGWVMSANGRKVCADFPAIYRDNGESESNLKLISAAPELLEGCVSAHRDWGTLHDMILDMIEGGRLTEAMIPDDYMALTSALVGCAKTEQVVTDAIAKAEGK